MLYVDILQLHDVTFYISRKKGKHSPKSKLAPVNPGIAKLWGTSAVFVSEIGYGYRRHPAFLKVKSVLYLRLQTGVR